MNATLDILRKNNRWLDKLELIDFFILSFEDGFVNRHIRNYYSLNKKSNKVSN